MVFVFVHKDTKISMHSDILTELSGRHKQFIESNKLHTETPLMQQKIQVNNVLPKDIYRQKMEQNI